MGKEGIPTIRTAPAEMDDSPGREVNAPLGMDAETPLGADRARLYLLQRNIQPKGTQASGLPGEAFPKRKDTLCRKGRALSAPWARPHIITKRDVSQNRTPYSGEDNGIRRRGGGTVNRLKARIAFCLIQHRTLCRHCRQAYHQPKRSQVHCAHLRLPSLNTNTITQHRDLWKPTSSANHLSPEAPEAASPATAPPNGRAVQRRCPPLNKEGLFCAAAWRENARHDVATPPRRGLFRARNGARASMREDWPRGKGHPGRATRQRWLPWEGAEPRGWGAAGVEPPSHHHGASAFHGRRRRLS